MSVLQFSGGQCPQTCVPAPRSVYAVTSGFPPRKTRPRSYNRNDQTFANQNTKNNIPQAALINIVAAVNVDLHGQSFLRRGNTQVNTSFDTVLSTLPVRAVSIPQPQQRIFNMPGKIVQRKPVYYKNSPDLEVGRGSRILFNGNLDRPSLRVRSSKPVDAKRQSVQAKTFSPKPQLIVNKHANMSFDNDKAKSEPIDRNGSSNRESRASSGFRKLGNVKVREVKAVKEIPKCDAVDLMDTHDIDPGMSVLDDSRKIIPSDSHIPIPYIRTKSLPALFPAKTTKRPDSVPQNHQRLFKERPLSHHMQKRLKISSCDTNTNLSNLESSLNVHRFIYTSSQLNSRSNFTCRVICQARTKSSALRRQATEFHFGKEIQRTSSHRSSNSGFKRLLSGKSSISTDLSVKTTISSLSIKSCLTSRSEKTQPHCSGQNTTRKVKFSGNSSENDRSEMYDLSEDERKTELISPTEPLCSSLGGKPMSNQELLTVQQRVLPANTPFENQYKPVLRPDTAITIQGLTRSCTEISPQNSKLECQESAQILGKPTHEFDGFREATNKIRTEKESKEEDSSADDSDKSTSSDDEAHNLHDMPALSLCRRNNVEYYRLFKAVDLHSYDGYEHKKLRRSASSSRVKETNPQKSYFVKVRLS